MLHDGAGQNVYHGLSEKEAAAKSNAMLVGFFGALGGFLVFLWLSSPY